MVPHKPCPGLELIHSQDVFGFLNTMLDENLCACIYANAFFVYWIRSALVNDYLISIPDLVFILLITKSLCSIRFSCLFQMYTFLKWYSPFKVPFAVLRTLISSQSSRSSSLMYTDTLMLWSVTVRRFGFGPRLPFRSGRTNSGFSK